MLALTRNRDFGMTVEMWDYRGRRAMAERVQGPADSSAGNETTETAQPPDASAETTDTERAETEQTTAQRRARLQKEIRAGMQRALKHQG